MGSMIRLDKFLAEMGEGSRSQVKEMVRKGRVQVNSQTVKESNEKVDPAQDLIQVDERIISYAAKEYYLLNKPQGVVSATEDRIHLTVVSLLTQARRSDLFPVGRLDIDTEGLLLITNDGDLAHRLLSPKKHVDKTYYAEISGSLPGDSQEQMERGLLLEDGTKTRPARLSILDPSEEKGRSGDGFAPSFTRVTLTIQEGKFHQVKRMFEALGCRVTYLKRISMGPLILDDDLAPGQSRPLTEEELEKLMDVSAGEVR